MDAVRLRAALIAAGLSGTAACGDQQWDFGVVPDAGDASRRAAPAPDASRVLPLRTDAEAFEPFDATFPTDAFFEFDGGRGFGGGFPRFADAGNVGCRSSQDCIFPRVALNCDYPTGKCVECTERSQCNAPLVACNQMTNQCVECTRDDDCQPGEVCDGTANECVLTCADAGQSACPPSAVRCVQPPGYCQGCTNDQQCQGTGPGTICNSVGRCVECVFSEHCRGNPNGSVCDQAINECVECVTIGDCKGLGVCDPSSHTCVGF